MRIILEDIGKQFAYNTILKGITIEFNPSEVYAIAGANGSGKSTLMKIIAGFLSPSKGNIRYFLDKEVKRDEIYGHLSYGAPYINTTQELTLQELLQFYRKFKTIDERISYRDFLEFIELKDTKAKAVSYFSSGMKQKVLLGLNLLSDSEVLLLDEPTSYLDVEAQEWFQDRLQRLLKSKTIIIASNERRDFRHCTIQYAITEKQLIQVN